MNNDKFDASVVKRNSDLFLQCKYCEFNYKIDRWNVDEVNTLKMKEHFNDKHWYIKKHTYPEKEKVVGRDKVQKLLRVLPLFSVNKVLFYGKPVYNSERELSLSEQENVERIEVDGEYIWKWKKQQKTSYDKGFIPIKGGKNLGDQKIVEYMHNIFSKYPKMAECRITSEDSIAELQVKDNIHGNFVLRYRILKDEGDDTVDWTV